MGLFDFKSVSYISDDKSILKNLTMTVEAGDYISIVGPSGSGKSTFLKLCCHLISPSEGTVYYKGRTILEQDPMEVRKQAVYCFQTPYLFGDKVEDNLVFPYTLRHAKADFARINELLSTFGLDKELLKKEVKNLSGGEKQRVALIRALLLKPEVLLLDEVTSALDVENSMIVEENIKSLNNEGTTVLWVTHNLEQSRRNANKVLTIEGGEIKSLEVLR
ncbi:MAG: ATP-binding cassette domain-containing protein [Bacillota bacterium]|nr:ATP-binding cassette domain-containing protein [Bacillota bacterium]